MKGVGKPFKVLLIKKNNIRNYKFSRYLKYRGGRTATYQNNLLLEHSSEFCSNLNLGYFDVKMCHPYLLRQFIKLNII